MGRSGIPPVQHGAVGGARDRRCLADSLIGRTGAVETDSGRRDRFGCARLRGHGGFEATIHPRPLQWRVRTGGGRGAQTSFQRTRRCLDTRAGLLHDLGRMSVSNRIWEKRGPLTASEWEQVRLHAYQSERILVRSPLLAPLAPLAGMHHEQQDGSAYHRQAAGHAVPLGARVLAAADAFQAMTQERPYRPALASATAADQLTAEVSRGRLDGGAVRAVLEVAGHRTRPARSAWPAGLSDREVEVLQVIATGG